MEKDWIDYLPENIKRQDDPLGGDSVVFSHLNCIEIVMKKLLEEGKFPKELLK